MNNEVFVRFWHGRKSEHEEMQYWGTNGPIVGPCFVRIIYGEFTMCQEKIISPPMHEGMFVFDGILYGEVEIMTHDCIQEFIEANPDTKNLSFDAFCEIIGRYSSFAPHGTYSYSNACGYEVEISRDNDAARLRINGHLPNPTITDWLPIETVEDEDNPGEVCYVIAPDTYNVPLSDVLKV